MAAPTSYQIAPSMNAYGRDQYGNPLAITNTYALDNDYGPNANEDLRAMLMKNIAAMGMPGSADSVGGSSGWFGEHIAQPGDEFFNKYMDYAIQDPRDLYQRIANAVNPRGHDLGGQGGAANLLKTAYDEQAARTKQATDSALAHGRYVAGMQNSADANKLNYFNQLMSNARSMGSEQNQIRQSLFNARNQATGQNAQILMGLAPKTQQNYQNMWANKHQRQAYDTQQGQLNQGKSIAAMYSSPFGSPAYMPNDLAIQQKRSGWV